MTTATPIDRSKRHISIDRSERHIPIVRDYRAVLMKQLKRLRPHQVCKIERRRVATLQAEPAELPGPLEKCL